jgi:hypothetical protein
MTLLGTDSEIDNLWLLMLFCTYMLVPITAGNIGEEIRYGRALAQRRGLS